MNTIMANGIELAWDSFGDADTEAFLLSVLKEFRGVDRRNAVGDGRPPRVIRPSLHIESYGCGLGVSTVLGGSIG